MGVTRDERVGRLEESVEIIKALWPGEPVTMRGRFWSLTDVRLEPRPVRRKLEFWLGGSAPPALRRIGRIADGWLASFVGPDEFGGMVDVIRASAAEAGRSIDEDHYGATIFAAPERGRAAGRRAPAARPPRRARARGPHRLRDRRAARAASSASAPPARPSSWRSPMARDLVPWLREMYAEAIEPFEAVA